MLQEKLKSNLLIGIIIIISYLINDYLGFACSTLIFIILLSEKKCSLIEKIIDMLIISMPLHSISVFGEKVNHMLSWPIIFLSIITIYNIIVIIKYKIKIPIKIIILSVVSLMLLVISNIRFNILTGTIEIIQILIMALPILTTFICKDKLKTRTQFINGLLKKIEEIVLATAIGVVFQFALYKIFDTVTGNITIFPNREVYDLFFKAYSVLSVYLGIGIVIKVIKMIKKISIVDVIEVLLILAAIVINSSRTGLLAAILTILILVNVKIKGRKRVIIDISIIVMGLITFCILTYTRNDITNFFNSNSRFETYEYGIKLTLKSLESFLLGNGLDLNNYNEIIPHNSIIETITMCGIPFALLIIYSITKLLSYIKKTDYRFIIYHILISSMFITCFQGNPFTTILIIIAIISEMTEDKKNENINCSTNI